MKQMLLILLALASPGCASPMIERSDVAIEVSPHSNAKFSALKTMRRGETMIVSGNIQSVRSLSLKGHVDIAGYAKGSKVRSATADILYFSPQRPRPAYFRGRLAEGAENLDLINVSYDDGPKHPAND